MTTTNTAKLSSPAVAARLGITTKTVHALCRSGALRAINVSADPTKRDHWKIDEADLKAFEEARRGYTA